MYTVKIVWTRHGNSEEKHPHGYDEAFTYIQADEIRVTSFIEANKRAEAMKHWDERLVNDPFSPGYENFLCEGPNGEDGGRLIQIIKDGSHRWVLATNAWLLGADGRNIDRLAP